MSKSNKQGIKTSDLTPEEQKKLQKQMAKKLLEASEDKINRNIRDSVFCDLFGQPKYLLQLYQVLHPEDQTTKEEDLTIVTLSRILVRVMYNDLGFVVGNRLIVLVEAQSTWSENILVRFLMYLGETYHRYIEKNDLDVYSTKKVELPRPELYVVYTGNRQTRPEKISLKNSFWNTDDCCVDVEAKVFYESETGDILNQFITFSRVFDEHRRLYPDDLWKAVQETIRICRDRDILRDYLGQEEAATIMFTLADQEKALQLTIKREREEERVKVEAKAQRQLDAAEARADAEAKRADAAEARVHELERQLAEMKT